MGDAGFSYTHSTCVPTYIQKYSKLMLTHPTGDSLLSLRTCFLSNHKSIAFSLLILFGLFSLSVLLAVVVAGLVLTTIHLIASILLIAGTVKVREPTTFPQCRVSSCCAITRIASFKYDHIIQKKQTNCEMLRFHFCPPSRTLHTPSTAVFL